METKIRIIKDSCDSESTIVGRVFKATITKFGAMVPMAEFRKYTNYNWGKDHVFFSSDEYEVIK